MAKTKHVSFVEKDKPKSRSKKAGLITPQEELGGSGTKLLNGFINEEYNPKLSGLAGIAVYDEMRKSDGTVKAAVQAVTLPILSAKWYVKAASEDDADKEIAEFVSKCFFELQSVSWDYVLRHALMSLPLGVMVFEKVYDAANVDGTERIILRKLAPRLPSSIQKWSIGVDIPGITQRLADGRVVEIPMEKCVVIVNEMEGENWWGTSILRAPYKHWFMKNTFYKIDAIAFERQGLGVPFGKMPPGASQSDADELAKVLKTMRSNNQAYVVVQDGYEIGFLDMQARTTRDPSTSIAHHNREIMKSVLAQFLELGADSQTGSKAVSTDHSELFMQSMQSVATNIEASLNSFVVKELVDLNFPNVQKYPVLKCPSIKSEDVAAITAAYSSLVTAGAVIPSDQDEQYFRSMLGLPERDVDEEPRSQKEDDPKKEEDMSMSESKKKDIHTHEHPHIALSEGFKGFRKLTFAEQKVDFESLQKQLDKLEEQYSGTTKELLHEARSEFIKKMNKAVSDGDIKAVKDLTLKVKQDLSRITKGAFTSAYTEGKNSAARELKVKSPATTRQILQNIDLAADAIAESQIAEIVTDAKNALAQALQKGASAAVAVAAADTAAQSAIDDLIDDTSNIVMAGYVNHGRNDLFEINAPDIYGLQRSEILDHATCPFCLSVDARVIEKDDDFGKNTIFHSGCRGIWVAIKMDEEEKPSIDGIPKTIRDRFGSEVNDLIQPKNPQTKKDSLARKEVERRLKRKAQ